MPSIFLAMFVFQSTPSVGRATYVTNMQSGANYDFNPRPPWGGRPERMCTNDYRNNFNPRPPWGGRPSGVRFAVNCKDFNPRPPWGGRRFPQPACRSNHSYFNPRPPWGGRPEIQGGARCRRKNFNPRPPWGGRRRKNLRNISKSLFQSTPSVGRATYGFALRRGNRCISIHALRGEGDPCGGF